MFEQFRATKDWPGETCYIIGGGPSLLEQDKNLLDGKRIIAINSSYIAFPDAAYVIFADMRWWIDHRVALMNFKGKPIGATNAASGPPKVYRMIRKTQPGLADDPGTVMVQNTTLTAAINLAVHLGVAKIVLLGIDQKHAADGRTHHHAPHKWRSMSNCYIRQQRDLPKIAEDLKARNIECVNASPGSALALWPIVNLEDHVVTADPCDRSSGVGGQYIPASIHQAAGARA